MHNQCKFVSFFPIQDYFYSIHLQHFIFYYLNRFDQWFELLLSHTTLLYYIRFIIQSLLHFRFSRFPFIIRL